VLLLSEVLDLTPFLPPGSDHESSSKNRILTTQDKWAAGVRIKPYFWEPLRVGGVHLYRITVLLLYLLGTGSRGKCEKSQDSTFP
jgi:hypothetical protein